jgi:hypothetical protein
MSSGFDRLATAPIAAARCSRSLAPDMTTTGTLATAEPGHFQIQQHQAWGLRRPVPHGAEQVQRLEPVLGRHGVKPGGGEQLLEHRPDLGIVFDDQHVTCGDSHPVQPGIKSRAASTMT